MEVMGKVPMIIRLLNEHLEDVLHDEPPCCWGLVIGPANGMLFKKGWV